MAAYFAFAQRSSDEKMIKLFFFKITNPDTIQQARCITRDSTIATRHVSGTIIPKRAPYNPEWSFHLDPETIEFFVIKTEVCDANLTFVEDHLDEVGGSTLPNSHWCPWSSQLIAEVPHLIDPGTERLTL
jgi:hypothetical protein